jgi:hypothetical protein
MNIKYLRKIKGKQRGTELETQFFEKYEFYLHDWERYYYNCLAK